MKVQTVHVKSFVCAWMRTFAQIFPDDMIKSKFYLFVVCLFVTLGATAQDQHFSQFYAAPLALNPALTGALEGKYRVGMINRSQWKQVLEAPIRTFAVGADLRFRAGRRKVKEDAIGLGLMFLNDKVGIVDFSTTQIAVSLAYHKSLGVNNRQFLSIGLQGGLVQRNVNYDALYFQDQFNGFTGYTLSTEEQYATNNFSFADYNVGLNYSADIGRNGRLFVGGAYHHFMQPRVAFYESVTDGGRLFSRASVQVAANLPLDKRSRFSILPRFLAAAQGPHMEFNAGTNFRAALGQYGSSALHFGGWARPVTGVSGMKLDAVVAMLGIELNNVLFGFSYDLNPRALQANQRQSAFEFSIAYLGSYENESIVCPKF